MNDTVNRRNAIKKMAGAGTAAALGAGALTPVRADTYNFTNDQDQVEVVGGWLTSKKGNKHMPVVTVNRQGDLAVIKAVVKHPQTSRHHIEAIHLYDADRLLISTVQLHPSQSSPEATFYVRVPAGTRLIALGDCNLHGLWFTEFVA